MVRPVSQLLDADLLRIRLYDLDDSIKELLGKVHVVRRVGTSNTTIATESLHGLGDHIPASV